MPLDLLSLGIGFTAGVAATGFAWNLAQARTVKNPEHTRVAGASWALSEVSRSSPPAVMAERIEGIDVPAGAKVLVPRDRADAVPPRVLALCDVRMHPGVSMNYALGRERALVFSSHMHPRAHAVYTNEESAVKRLQREFTDMWNEAEPYIQKVPLSAVADMDGRYVEVTGVASEVVEFRGRRMMRLSDGGTTVGVVTPDGGVAELQGKPVLVSGRVSRDGGMVHIDARRVAKAPPKTAIGAAPGA